MRQLWSEYTRRKTWRQIWVTLAAVQSEFGLVSANQLDDLRSHMNQVDLERSNEIEASIHHDLMAELRVYAEQSEIGGGVLHLGATSADIQDNADVLRFRTALQLLTSKLGMLLKHLSDQILTYADLPVIGMTHLQPAEPTTLGYRLAQYGQDLLDDYHRLNTISKRLKGKGFKGAVGTAAAYADLIGAERFDQFEGELSRQLSLEFFPVSTQVYMR